MAQRNVTVFSTGGNNRKVTFPSSAKTWGDLKNDMDDNGVSYDGMTAVERTSKNAFTVNESVLPEGDFLIYLMPEKTKSGVDASTWPHKQCKQFIQAAIEKYGDAALKHFNKGDNYTRKSTEKLRKLVNTFPGAVSLKPTAPVVKEAPKKDSMQKVAQKAAELTMEQLAREAEDLRMEMGG
jgi:hypothetical protein